MVLLILLLTSSKAFGVQYFKWKLGYGNGIYAKKTHEFKDDKKSALIDVGRGFSCYATEVKGSVNKQIGSVMEQRWLFCGKDMIWSSIIGFCMSGAMNNLATMQLWNTDNKGHPKDDGITITFQCIE
jgi:hypothetical protein